MKLRDLPPPTTFAEGQRLAYGCIAAAAGVAVGLGAVALVAILVWGGWPSSLFAAIVQILGWALLGAIGIMGLVIGGLLLGGPVGRFSGKIGKDGVELEGSAQGEKQ